MSGLTPRDALAKAVEDHVYTYPDSFCECGAYINGHADWRDHLALVLLASGAVEIAAAAKVRAMSNDMDLGRRFAGAGWPEILRTTATVLEERQS